VLASWKKLAAPKENGGWGLKNLFLFSKALAAKKCMEVGTRRRIVGLGNQSQVFVPKHS
jgi:hypothetical protein